MKSLFAAIRFLTVLPLPSADPEDAAVLGRSVRFFPVIGLLAGLVMVGLDAVLGAVLPAGPRNVLIVLAMVGVSGGLHLDGLADTADGFLSSRPRERVLEIMKDSRIGTMGVLAIVGALALKVSALASIPADRRWPALLLMPLAGRTALVIAMNVLPYARPTGLGATFEAHKSRWDAIWAIGILAMTGYAAAGWHGLCAAAGTIIVTVVVALWSQSKIGGWTGDTVGAACELCETVPALLAGVP
ncbi:MAG TPA: adenosylcobinamide-GDP ribazoletransferase [Candidatus Baltobacteraceae bacterium]|nr:adenosylcobinamide-GDP ribazoletransferase [Candidatus Baltobacteraceae bacterium]